MYPAAAYAVLHSITNAAPIDEGRYYIRRPGSRAIMRCHPEGTPGIDTDATVEINALGLRGRMPEDRDWPKILVIGGSTVEDALLNDAGTWCGQLEARLPGSWVGNMGRSGCTARHHALQLEKCLPQLPKADAVVVLCGLNDMLADLGCHGVEREPTAAGCFGLAPGVESVDLPPGFFNVGEDFARLKRRRAQVRPEHFQHRSPTASDLALYRGSLEQIVDRIVENGAPPVLVTQPALWRFGMSERDQTWLYAGGSGSPDRWVEDPETPWLSPLSLAMALDAYNAVMRAVGADRAVPVIDLARHLPRETEHFYDDFHFSRAGAALVAEIVATGIRAPIDAHSLNSRLPSR